MEETAQQIACEIARDIDRANYRGVDFGDMPFAELCKCIGEENGYTQDQIDLDLVEEELGRLEELRQYE